MPIDDRVTNRYLLVLTDALLVMTILLCFLNLKFYSDLNSQVLVLTEQQRDHTEHISRLERRQNRKATPDVKP